MPPQGATTPRNLRAIAALEAAEKRIRTFNKKLVAIESNDRMDKNKKKNVVQQYKETIKKIKQQFIEKFGENI